MYTQPKELVLNLTLLSLLPCDLQPLTSQDIQFISICLKCKHFHNKRNNFSVFTCSFFEKFEELGLE